MPGDLVYDDQEDMRIKLRETAGQHISQKHATDAAIDAAAEKARRLINKRRPILTLGTFETVADQATYAGAAAGTPPVNRIERLQVFAQGAVNTFRPVIDDDRGSPLRVEGQTLAPMHRDALVLLRADDTTNMSQEQMQTALVNAEFFERFFASRGYDDATAARLTPTIVISPTPDNAADVVYWIATVPRFSTKNAIYSELTEDFSEEFEEAAMWQMFRSIAIHLAEQKQQKIGVAGIELETDAAIAHKASIAAQQRFDALLPRRSSANAGAGIVSSFAY